MSFSLRGDWFTDPEPDEPLPDRFEENGVVALINLLVREDRADG